MSEPNPAPPRLWCTPEELGAIGFERSSVVLMNEAHHMFLRSIASIRRRTARCVRGRFAAEAVFAGLA